MHAFPPAPGAQPRPLARQRSAYTHGVCAHESTYDTAYVPASLSHVQLYVAVPMSVTSSHRQFASGEHVFGSHPSTSAPELAEFPNGSHVSPVDPSGLVPSASYAPFPHDGGGGGGDGGGLGGLGGGAASAGALVTVSAVASRRPMTYRLDNNAVESYVALDDPDDGVNASATTEALEKSLTFTANRTSSCEDD